MTPRTIPRALAGAGFALAAACSSQPAAEVRVVPRTKHVESLPGPDGDSDPPSLTGPATGQGPTIAELPVESYGLTDGGPATTTTVTVTTPASIEVFEVTEPVAVEESEPEAGYEGADREYVLGCIRSYEQGADGYATETGNGFSSGYQFTPGTWAYAVAGAGHPEWADSPASSAPPWVQDDAAWWLFQQEGYGPWPTPQAMC